MVHTLSSKQRHTEKWLWCKKLSPLTHNDGLLLCSQTTYALSNGENNVSASKSFATICYCHTQSGDWTQSVYPSSGISCCWQWRWLHQFLTRLHSLQYIGCKRWASSTVTEIMTIMNMIYGSDLHSDNQDCYCCFLQMNCNYHKWVNKHYWFSVYYDDISLRYRTATVLWWSTKTLKELSELVFLHSQH